MLLWDARQEIELPAGVKMGRLDNKVALISGGARGQGAVETMLFTKEGAKVVFGDLLDEEGQALEAKVRETGGDAIYLHLDVTSERDWRQAIDLAEARYGKLDILVNNAGITRFLSMEDTTEKVWDEIMDVNAKGVFLGTKCAIPEMKRAGGGSIVNISSIAGIVAYGRGSPAYNASKGAIRVFTKVTAVQYAKDKIRCNSIHPGTIDTPMIQTAASHSTREQRISQIPLGRIGTSEDVGYGALYLASDEASWVTGIELIIDGGVTAQ